MRRRRKRPRSPFEAAWKSRKDGELVSVSTPSLPLRHSRRRPTSILRQQVYTHSEASHILNRTTNGFDFAVRTRARPSASFVGLSLLSPSSQRLSPLQRTPTKDSASNLRWPVALPPASRISSQRITRARKENPELGVSVCSRRLQPCSKSSTSTDLSLQEQLSIISGPTSGSSSSGDSSTLYPSR